MIKIRDFEKLFKSEKATKLIIMLGFLGILLVFVSDWGAKKEKPAEDFASQSKAYINQLQTNLRGILEETEGVGKASVMITLEGGQQYIYAQDEKQNTDETADFENGEKSKLKTIENSEKSYVFINGGADKKALKITELEPNVKGVLIVCQGGGSSVTKARITEAVSTALGIKYSQIFVAKSK